MSEPRPPQMFTPAQFEKLVSALDAETEQDGRTIYRNTVGVTCPNPKCDRGPFEVLIVSEAGWQEFTANVEGVSAHFTTVEDKSLLFIHEP